MLFRSLELPDAHRAVEDAIASYLLFFLLLNDETLHVSPEVVRFFGERQEDLWAALRADCGMRVSVPKKDVL